MLSVRSLARFMVGQQCQLHVRNHTDGTGGLVAHLTSHFDIAYGGASVFKVMTPAGRTP